MYQQGVLRQPGTSEFTVACDTWSLGVTLFQVITGHLPFQAFEGREDTQTQYGILLFSMHVFHTEFVKVIVLFSLFSYASTSR